MGSVTYWCAALCAAALLSFSGGASAETPDWNNPKFEWYRQVYINCPARVFTLEPGQVATDAEWFADPANQKHVDKILATCAKEEKHLAKRAWPPTKEGARNVLPSRYFRWDPVLQRQVEERLPRQKLQ